MDHLVDRDLKGFLEGRLGSKARRRVVRHLVSRCEKCPERLRSLIPPELLWTTSTAEPEEAYDACLDRALAAVRPLVSSWTKERKRKQQGVALVLEKGWGNLSAAERRIFGTGWARVEMLLELSFEMRYRNRQVMLEIALSAQRSADRLQPTLACPESLLSDLRARAAAEVANAERVNERFLRAEDTIAKARSLLDHGTGDQSVHAYLDEIEASLRNAQRRHGEAEALLNRAYHAYRKLGEQHLAGRALVTKGLCQRLAGKPLDAIKVLREAVELLEAPVDPQLYAVAQQCLLDALVDAGDLREASRLLLESGLRQTFADDPLNLLRIRWVEGKIARRPRPLQGGRAGLHRSARRLPRAGAGIRRRRGRPRSREAPAPPGQGRTAPRAGEGARGARQGAQDPSRGGQRPARLRIRLPRQGRLGAATPS